MRFELPDYMKNSVGTFNKIDDGTLAVHFPYDQNPILVDYSEVMKWRKILMEVYPAIKDIEVSINAGDGVLMLAHKKEEYL